MESTTIFVKNDFNVIKLMGLIYCVRPGPHESMEGKPMSSPKIPARLAVGLGLVALIGIAIALLGAVALRSLSASLQEVTADRMVKVAQFTELKDNQNAIARYARNIVISGNTAVQREEKRKLAELREADEKLLQALDMSVTRPEARKSMDALWQNRAEYNMALERAVDLAERGERAAAGALLLGELRPRQSLMFQSVDESRALQQQFADALAQDAARSAARVTLVLAAMGTAIAVLALLLGWSFARGRSRASGGEPAASAAVAWRSPDARAGNPSHGLPLQSAGAFIAGNDAAVRP
ncbi:sensor domain CHASE3-containing protein [Paracidovorax cattleyae]|uniref:Sensor domain CHASE3-containing protein n=3 Tax=Paracidovorax cattleyae TaxID=80868 RepID=A0A1H0WQ82_9BURK|nr:MCP four helix bundle domain-containing protein [Paracidovorax cattleyae]SDP92799.1 sensor domain CHASE3-containing protein [Paracidovorax cattleyae]